MKKILKNNIRQHVKGFFRGKEKLFKSKTSKVFDLDDEEQKAEYFYWLETYGFITDITSKVGDI